MSRSQPSDEQRAPQRTRRRSLQAPMLLWLTLVWVLLWGQFSPANIVAGLAVAVMVKLVFPLPPIIFEGRIRPWLLLKLVGRFLLDVVVASVDVARQTLRWRTDPVNAVIEVTLRSRSDLSLTLTAELVSLIPGSVVVEAHRSTHTLFLHVLDARDTDGVERARAAVLDLERRVVGAMGSDSDRARVRRALRPDTSISGGTR